MKEKKEEQLKADLKKASQIEKKFQINKKDTLLSLNVVSNACSGYRGTLQEHNNIQTALKVIATFINERE